MNGAAVQFSEAYDAGLIPMEFVNSMRKKGQLIMGIGHRVKSINNPDMRVKIMKEFVKANFPTTPLLDYALEVQLHFESLKNPQLADFVITMNKYTQQVEKITTSKKPNLILNVDGVIAVSFVDFLRNSGCFTA